MSTGATSHGFVRLRLVVSLGWLVLWPAVAGAWNVRTLANYGQATRQPTVVVDQAGTVHVVSYPTIGFGDAVYGTFASGTFTEEPVPGSEVTGTRLFLAADANREAVFLAYGDFEMLGLYRRVAGAWPPTPVPLPNARAIAFDPGNHPHIAYGGFCDFGECGCAFDEVRFEILHGTDAGGSWASDAAVGECRPETQIGSAQALAFAVDRQGKAHVAWLEGGTFQVRYATNASGAWSASTIATVGSDTQAWDHPLDLAVDSSGHPHVVFYDDRDPDLAVHYATDAGSGWQIARLRDLTVYPSIVVDPNDVVHVVFDSPWRSEMMHASRAVAQPLDAWQEERIARVGGDAVPALTLDAAGTLHLVYYEPADQTLRYATNSGGPSPGDPTETTVAQVKQKPVLQVTCTRPASGTKDGCIAQAFVVDATSSAAGAFVVASGAAPVPATNEVTRRFGKKKTVKKFKIRLNRVAKRLLKESPTGSLDVEVQIRLESDSQRLLKRLVRMVRKGQ